MLDIPIIYEDDFLLVIDKPAGLVVNRAQSVKGETLQDWIERKFEIRNSRLAGGQAKSEIKDNHLDFYNRAGIVHRLDKDTSGLLLIAKTPEAFFDLQLQFKERKVTKKYLALCHGKIIPEEGEIKASVGRLPWNRERFGVLPGGREAVTFYKLLDIYLSKKGDVFSLVELTPHTGRTHQIRIHLKYLGFPIVSDNFYAGRKIYINDIQFCPRLFLHAGFIKFYHAKLNKFFEFTAKIPKDLLQVLSEMEKRDR